MVLLIIMVLRIRAFSRTQNQRMVVKYLYSYVTSNKDKYAVAIDTKYPFMVCETVGRERQRSSSTVYLSFTKYATVLWRRGWKRCSVTSP